MRHALVLGIVTLALSACSKDDDNGSSSKTFTDVAHKASECPKNIEGQYFHQSNKGSDSFVVSRDANGHYVITGATGEKTVVNGKSKNLNNTTTVSSCVDGNIEIRSLFKDGFKNVWTIKKNKTGVSIDQSNSDGKKSKLAYRRVGGMTSDDSMPGEMPDLSEMPQMPDMSEGGQSQMPSQEFEMPEMPEMPEASDRKQCNSGQYFSYTLRENGCTTKKREYCSISEYCAGLKNDELNRGCAKQTRNDMYDQSCR